jgi:hypothetical protein
MKGQGNITMPDYKKMGQRNKNYEVWFATDKMYTHMDAIDSGNIEASSENIRKLTPL